MMTCVHHYRIIGAFSCPETLLQVSYFSRFREVVEEEDGKYVESLGSGDGVPPSWPPTPKWRCWQSQPGVSLKASTRRKTCKDQSERTQARQSKKQRKHLHPFCKVPPKSHGISVWSSQGTVLEPTRPELETPNQPSGGWHVVHCKNQWFLC